MLSTLAKKVFGSRNDRLLRQYEKIVIQINALEPSLEVLSDAELQEKTSEFKKRLEQGASLDELLPEAFAVCREASLRTLKMRHFDTQLMGGIALHQGKIAEMRTGEGKTLVATLAVYLNALTGKGVHVITVNDYLASRDAQLLSKLYNFLGLSVGVNLSQMESAAKQEAYAADITYGTNNEFGFDYLRDNMVYSQAEKVQKQLSFAVVDEVDSILIDEARTPLIISGPADDDVDLYQIIDAVPTHLTRQESEEGEGDYWVDEKTQSVILSEQGHENAENTLIQLGLLKEHESLYSAANISLIHHLMAALRAHSLFFKDQHYVIQEGEIVIVDEFTGRLMSGRRWSDGLHQAVEAKEKVEIKRENQTLASITFQNYFRLYDKLAGMTGTADTEAFEFQSIYGLETVIIPTNRPMIRKDLNDQIFRTTSEKFNAVITDIKERHLNGQPILVGTTSIEISELISSLLKAEGLFHNVLNAKEHEREAEIVAQAGSPGMITVATNMAGRGTDIVLGGNIEPTIALVEENNELSRVERVSQINQLRNEWEVAHDAVLAAGGLHIIGTERHESRRIDNQLRGRSGRQGDPGSSRFYLSFEDSLLRLFALDRAAALLNRLAPEDGAAIEHPLLTRQIEGAQRKVEGRNFDIRKQLLEYDDVANDQRKVIYQERNDILDSDNVSEMVTDMREEVLGNVVDDFLPPQSMEEQWDIPALEATLQADYNLDVSIVNWLQEDQAMDEVDIKQRIIALIETEYAKKIELVSADGMRQFEHNILLQMFDMHWREHLSAMDHLRQGIHLRSYAQKNPKQEYKREAFELFSSMLNTIKRSVVNILVTVRIENQAEIEASEPHVPEMHALHEEVAEGTGVAQDITSLPEDADLSAAGLAARGIFVGRNDPCPCNSGKKYKHCHGAIN